MEGAVDALGDFLRRHRVPKGSLREGGPYDEHGFMGRKPACSSFDCECCGFQKQGCTPACKALDTSDQLVTWTRYAEVERTGKKSLGNQQVEEKGKLCDLWADFKKKSKLYMNHHAKAKWQRNCHGLCLNTFKEGGIIIETDFIEKYTHEAGAVLTCSKHLQANLMVAIVRVSPQVWESDGRVHTTETWVFAFDDPAHDFDTHLDALNQIFDYYLDESESAATAAGRQDSRTPPMHMFTDGCAKQYTGRLNFRFLSASVRQLGFIVEPHFAATSHLKGCHDGPAVWLRMRRRRP